MGDEFYAYEKAEFSRLKYELEVSRPETVRFQDALRELLDFTARLFDDLDMGAEIEAEREELKAKIAARERELAAIYQRAAK